MADSSDVDAAIVAKLLGDSTLMALVPDGIYWDIGKHGASRVIVIKQLLHDEEYMFGGAAFETFEYAIKAVTLSTTGANVKAAAARIHALLQDTTLTVFGFDLMRIQRVERIRYDEPDDENKDARWQHRGGRYVVMVSPT